MLASSGEIHLAELRHNQSMLSRLLLRERGSNTSTTPFEVHSEGSGSQELMPETKHNLVSYVFRHHAYIASGQEVIILNLNSQNPVYQRVLIGYTPLQIKVYDYGSEIYLFVLYRTNSRDYIVTHRKYQDGGWGRYGRELLVTSPQWYDLNKISNIVIFQAQDTQFSYNTVYVAVGVSWSVHVCEIIDGSYFSLNVPKPCNNITRLNFNEKRQTMFIECAEGTLYYDFREYNYYYNSAWDRAFGAIQVSSDGRYGAIVSNITAYVSMVTVIDLQSHGNYEFASFRVISSIGKIAQSAFVTANSSLHYFCYVEVASNSGIYCISVELGMRNRALPGLAVSQLPNTRGICRKDSDCQRLYTHHSLLAVSTEQCMEQSCLDVLLLFDMASFTNVWNMSGIEVDFIAWKPDHSVPIVTAPTSTTAHTPTPTRTPAPPTRTPSPHHLTTVQPQATPAIPNIPPITTNHIPSLPPSHPPQEGTLATTDNPDTCQQRIEIANDSYERLLWILISVSISFSFVMIVTVILLVAMACVTTRHPKHSSKSCNQCTHDVQQLPKEK